MRALQITSSLLQVCVSWVASVLIFYLLRSSDDYVSVNIRLKHSICNEHFLGYSSFFAVIVLQRDDIFYKFFPEFSLIISKRMTFEKH